MQLGSQCYTAVLYEPVSKLYTYQNQPYSFPILGLRFFFFVFFLFVCFFQAIEIEKPD